MKMKRNLFIVLLICICITGCATAKNTTTVTEQESVGKISMEEVEPVIESIEEVTEEVEVAELEVEETSDLYEDEEALSESSSSDDESVEDIEDNISESQVSTEIGNPIIDANPDRYIPEGITGEIDPIDGTFYTKQAIGFTPGEYLIIGGGNGVITITEDYKFSLKFISNEVDFEDADMEEMINCAEACSYQVYGNGTGYVVSFYHDGLYLYTDHVDDENDWAEGFYEILN